MAKYSKSRDPNFKFWISDLICILFTTDGRFTIAFRYNCTVTIYCTRRSHLLPLAASANESEISGSLKVACLASPHKEFYPDLTAVDRE